ncbi:hypothetical protein O3P69_002603 [Scylla paramamosain]|uniref:Uncharacterized protein n=1 Tax=Scylla paramamosain TaxID=85552 RepID=A0AAW0UP12_SCYPA
MVELKTVATSPQESSRALVANVLSKLDEHSLAHVPSTSTMSHYVRHCRGEVLSLCSEKSVTPSETDLSCADEDDSLHLSQIIETPQELEDQAMMHSTPVINHRGLQPVIPMKQDKE